MKVTHGNKPFVQQRSLYKPSSKSVGLKMRNYEKFI